MIDEERYCLECGDILDNELHGATKYCPHRNCQKKHNARNTRDVNRQVALVGRAIVKNDEVLRKNYMLSQGKKGVFSHDLLTQGFNPKVHSKLVLNTATGEKYYLFLNYAYRVVESKFIIIEKKENIY